VNGSAYRTQIPAGQETLNVEAVYAVYPPALYSGGREATTHLFVSSSRMVGDTIIHPADCAGNVVSLELLACVQKLSHRAALEAAGYDLEVVTHARA
jgi:hypothetical protein